MKKGESVKYGLWALALLLLMLTQYMVFVYVPTEKTMGIVQRIFYLMVPSAWLAVLSFLIIFVSSILYLKSRQERWDTLASSAAELGLLFTTLTIMTGSLWARPIWGVWWTWEPRLTATLVLWLIYLAYFMVRSLATSEARAAVFGAVVGIIGFLDVPIIGMATTLWRGMHPGTIIFQGGLAPAMLATLLVSLAAYTALYFLLLALRIALKRSEDEIKNWKASAG